MANGKASNGRDFLNDGDVFGNLWCNASGQLGYAGVFVYNAQGAAPG